MALVGGLAVLMVFQLVGEIIVTALGLPIPGPVVGMALLFAALLIKGGPPQGLNRAAQGLIQHLSLMFIPAGSGVVAYVTLLRQELLPIGVALIGSTLFTLAVSAGTLHALARWTSGSNRSRDT
jgi:holin-like protein